MLEQLRLLPLALRGRWILTEQVHHLLIMVQAQMPDLQKENMDLGSGDDRAYEFIVQECVWSKRRNATWCKQRAPTWEALLDPLYSTIRSIASSGLLRTLDLACLIIHFAIYRQELR